MKVTEIIKVTGPQGDTGLTGPQGRIGSQGYQGTQGYQGSQGPQGDTGGPQGAQGAQGPQGASGGPQGTQGNQGFQGNQGNQGTQGNQGFQGAQGNQGFQGTTGAQGTQGNQGFQGAVGTVATTGWIPVTDSWSYATNSSLTVPSDATTTYQKGYRVKFTQSSVVKYGTIIAVASTVLSLAPNDDYIVSNNPITDIYYSPIENPLGYPQQFNYTITAAAGGGSSMTVGSASVAYAKFSISGNVCKVYSSLSVTLGGSGDLYWTISPPFTGDVGYSVQGGNGVGVDPVAGTFAMPIQLVSGTAFRLYQATTGNWGLGAGAYARVTGLEYLF